MAVSVKGAGIDELSEQIFALGESAESCAKACLYTGAGLVADRLKEATLAIPIETLRFIREDDPKMSYLAEDDREDLANGLGIAKFDSSGIEVSASVGFNGYTRHPTKKYTSGIPLALLARSISSGSSVRNKHPFVRMLANKVAKDACEAMQTRMDEYVAKTTEGENNA